MFLKARFWLIIWGALMVVSCGKKNDQAGATVKPLVVGLDATYRPFEFVDEQGQVTGVSAGIAREIAKDLQRPLEFRNLSFDGLITALRTGAVDLVISSMTVTEERRRAIDFSDPYARIGLALLVGKNSTVKVTADLQKDGGRVAVRIGTTGESWCVANLPKATLVRLDNDAACVLEVINGTVDAWIYDQISVMNYQAKHPQQTRALLTPLRAEEWAVGVRKERGDELLQQVNQTLQRMRSDGGFKALAGQFLAAEQEQMAAQGVPFVFDVE